MRAFLQIKEKQIETLKQYILTKKREEMKKRQREKKREKEKKSESEKSIIYNNTIGDFDCLFFANKQSLLLRTSTRFPTCKTTHRTPV